MTILRVGFIGAGEQGINNLLPAMLQVSGARVAAICDQDASRGEIAAARAGGVPYYEDPKKMIESGKLDAVVMAAPPNVHRDIGHFAIEHGLHTFVEKPPCMTTRELLDLIAASRKHGVTTGVGLNYRFASAVQRFHEVSKNPLFGELVHLGIMHAANKPRAPMWGTNTTRAFMLAQAIHSVDLAISFGGELDKVDVSVREKGKSSIIQIDLSFESGATGSLLTGSAFPVFAYEMLAVGSGGHMMRLENFWDLTLLSEGRQGPLIGDGKRWREAWHPSPLESGYARSGYFGELQAFTDAIQQKKRFVADYEAMLPTYKVIDAVVDAASSTHTTSRAAASPEVAHV
ncbi:Gfo/Idh/MocA family protein [Pendulispora albinea]|uniref:Gfo/Idh/MocA family oxidoreductase n=1 Tax=Pendulispora albinea TaxID=2741071 RepID=A0ABZ2M1P0_9BACT